MHIFRPHYHTSPNTDACDINYVNKMRLGQKGRHFAEHVFFKYIFAWKLLYFDSNFTESSSYLTV